MNKKMKMLWVVLLFIGYQVGAQSYQAAVLDVSFQIKGKIEITQYSTAGKIATKEERDFNCESARGKWWIETSMRTGLQVIGQSAQKSLRLAKRQHPERYANPHTNVTWIAGTDGNDNFIYGVLNDVYQPVVGYSRPGVLPFDDVGKCVSPVWLAFCSYQYLATNKNGKLPPMWPLKDENVFHQGYLVDVDIKYQNTEPHLPASIVFKNGGIKLVTETDQFGNTTTQQKLSPPYDSGFTEAIYKVLSFTNVGEMSFPLEFDFTVFTPKRNGTNLTTPKLKYHGVLLTVTPGISRTSFVPELRLGMEPVIIDKRFSKEYPNIPVIFQPTNGVWPSSTNPALLDILEKAKQKDLLINKSIKGEQYIPETRIKRSTKKAIVLGLLVFILAAPVLVYAYLINGKTQC